MEQLDLRKHLKVGDVVTLSNGKEVTIVAISNDGGKRVIAGKNSRGTLLYFHKSGKEIEKGLSRGRDIDVLKIIKPLKSFRLITLYELAREYPGLKFNDKGSIQLNHNTYFPSMYFKYMGRPLTEFKEDPSVPVLELFKKAISPISMVKSTTDNDVRSASN